MFKNIFSFSGRIRRTEFWLTVPLIWMIMAGISIITAAMPILIVILWIVPFWISLAASVKRSHDLGNSGWMILLPVYNPFFLMFANSQPFINGYGSNPKGINMTNSDSLIL